MKINKKNKLKRTLLLGSMAVATIAAPLAIAISCGTDTAPSKIPIDPSPITPTQAKNQFTGSFSSPAVKDKFMKITTTIQPDEFAGETGLTSINLPNVVVIGDNAFKDSNLGTIIMPNIVIIGANAFESAQLKDNSELTLNNVESVGNRAFASSKLTSLKMKMVKTIGANSFETAELQTLEIPKATQVGAFAFKNAKISSLTMPDVKNVGNSAFQVAELTTLEIPSVTLVGDNAFTSSKLTGTLSLPNVTSVGKNAFTNSTFLNISLPQTTIIGDSAFRDSSNIRTLALNSLETIGANVFENSSYTIETLTAPNLKNVGSKAFGIFGKTSELPNFNLNIDWNKLVNVGEEAFAGISNFPTGVTFNNLETVGGGAFRNYPTSMGALIIPKIKEIGGNGFSIFGGVPAGPTTITILTPEADVVFSGTSTFGYYGAAGQLTLKVPSNQIASWQQWIAQDKIDHPNDSVFPMPASDIVVVDVNA